MEKPRKIKCGDVLSGVDICSDEYSKVIEWHNKGLNEMEAYYKQEIEKLKKGENEWWRKRWLNNDAGKELFEIRKKWLTAYQCALNYQKSYEDLEKQMKELKAELQTLKATELSEGEILEMLNKVPKDSYCYNLDLARAVITARDKKRK